jgi:hypothetical protein
MCPLMDGHLYPRTYGCAGNIGPIVIDQDSAVRTVITNVKTSRRVGGIGNKLMHLMIHG